MSNTYKPLDDLLNKSGLKKEAIARKMNIDVSYLYKLRSNPKNISAIRLGEMAEVTGVDFAELYSTVKKFALEHDKLAKKDK
ncbi:MAG: helix-turn-helix domain-containing protein [Liquorilactobacillus nagelii]|jgi:transcriptional regulator with XRE-family HTH domain|uniref:helix-turn-helix domain-containing protein n=1 Tax=Liquorilactobacillus nagelii TaxID=82688 RepID=UPI00242CF1BC|nr:helix-turn-helix transcriptional regulator [Liquorilactobacillus nagelii]MCI1634536.1 helix-turn-helix domain-containing protein [Liquorilactobacillus nagelii]